MQKGDLVVIWKLDRFGRSLRGLVNLVTDIQAKGAGLKSLNDSIDTTTLQGKLTFYLSATLAEFERKIIRERIKAGLESARARGRKGGRPKGLTKVAKDKAIIASSFYAQKQMSVAGIYKHLGIAKSTFSSISPKTEEIGITKSDKLRGILNWILFFTFIKRLGLQGNLWLLLFRFTCRV